MNTFEIRAEVLTENFIADIDYIMTSWRDGISIWDAYEFELEDEDFMDDVDETFYDPYAGCEIWDNCNYEW